MSQFNIIFWGLYVTFFTTPIIAAVFRKRSDAFRVKLLGASGAIFILAYVARWVGVSFSGVSVDAIAMYLIYVLLGFCALQLCRFKHGIIKLIGILSFIPFVAIPLMSVPAILGVAFIVGDFEPRYTVTNEQGYLCRVTSYGNATTSNGGYNSNIFKEFGFFEYKVASVSVDSTRKPEITPAGICNDVFSGLQS